MNAASTASDLQTPTDANCVVRPHLFVAMKCAAPLELPSRHALEGVSEVLIGRDDACRVARDGGEGAPSRLTLTLSDSRVSTAHARLLRREHGWILEDRSSKNGTFLNGSLVHDSALADGDCIQVGHTLLVFRDRLLTPAGSPADVVGSAHAPALATLLPLLARQMDALVPIAASRVPVLLMSETGTGKELLANAVHTLSCRAGGFVPVNCGGLPANLVESVLFGHTRGSFSGANADHAGLFRAADHGTLLLDEVGDMPLGVQSAVLRALQGGEILPVGATRSVRVDVRVVSATHRDLEARVAEGTFREDLLARLSGFVFRLPPLRERREDIGLLVSIMLRRRVSETGRSTALSSAAGMLLLRHLWPRNVRELQKCLDHASTLAGDGPIEPAHLPESVRGGGGGRPAFLPQDQLHAQLITLLSQSGGNVSLVAETLHTSRSQVHRWMKRFSIDVKGFRR